MLKKSYFIILLSIHCFLQGDIHKYGYWLDNDQGYHFVKNLSSAIVEFFKKEKAETIYDLGAGNGRYTLHLLNHDLNCKAFDGNPCSEQISNGLVKTLNLAIPFELDYKADWILCIEVGEHIPKIYEETFINNLHLHNKKGIILSWAIKGQGGDGHFNEQDNEYIKDIFKKLNYINDLDAEMFLRKSAGDIYFKNTIMVFRKKNN